MPLAPITACRLPLPSKLAYRLPRTKLLAVTNCLPSCPSPLSVRHFPLNRNPNLNPNATKSIVYAAECGEYTNESAVYAAESTVYGTQSTVYGAESTVYGAGTSTNPLRLCPGNLGGWCRYRHQPLALGPWGCAWDPLHVYGPHPTQGLGILWVPGSLLGRPLLCN